MLYNAHCAGSPLLVVAGQQDRRLRISEPVLEGDMVRVARPWTKWAFEVQRAGDVPTALRRAVQTALTPPTGPVFLALPLDLQMEPIAQPDLRPPTVPDARMRPSLDALTRACGMLSDARNPAILAGSRVTESDAINELVALAEQLGAPVFSECATSHGRLPMPPDHPLYAGPLPLWIPEIRQRLNEFDVLFVAGMSVVRLYLWHEPGEPLPAHVRLVHLDSHAWDIAKNHPVDIGMVGDLKAGLGELNGQLKARLSPTQSSVAKERLQARQRKRRAEQADVRARIAAERSRRPMTATALMGALCDALPPDAVFVEEAVTTHQNLVETLGALRDPAGYFAHRGWALGWGLGCALGVKLAWPKRPVVALLGDGAALYGIQGLWTAAHHRIPVTFVIANNAEYKILKVCGHVLQLPQMTQKRFVGMDLTDPAIDFVELARSLGVEAQRVTDPDELSERLHQSLRGESPMLLDVPLSP
jgi:benzoylformate decarboxylase